MYMNMKKVLNKTYSYKLNIQSKKSFHNEFAYKWRLLLANKTRLLRTIVYAVCFYTIILIIITIVITFDGPTDFRKNTNVFPMK